MVDRKVVSFALWTCVVMLVLALSSSWPYGYYTLLRWAVCLTTGYLTYENYQKGHKGFSFIFGAIALLFNPITPVHLSKSGWASIDLVVDGFLFFYLVRGKSIRLKMERKLVKKLLLWGGVAVAVLFFWGVWSQYRYETYDYPVSLVTSRSGFNAEAYLKSLRGELTVHGWRVKSVDAPGTYLVSFTYSKPPGPLLKALRASRLNLATLPDQPSTRKETAGVATPSTWGWWWEVNTKVPLVRAVRGDPDLEKKYGVTPTRANLFDDLVPDAGSTASRPVPAIEYSPPTQPTFLTVQELNQIRLSGEIKQESDGFILTGRYLLLTIHNGTTKAVTHFRISITFYDGNFRISEQPLPARTDISGGVWNVNILQPGSTANYKIDISEIYPNTQVTRFELKLLEVST